MTVFLFVWNFVSRCMQSWFSVSRQALPFPSSACYTGIKFVPHLNIARCRERLRLLRFLILIRFKERPSGWSTVHHWYLLCNQLFHWINNVVLEWMFSSLPPTQCLLTMAFTLYTLFLFKGNGKMYVAHSGSAMDSTNPESELPKKKPFPLLATSFLVMMYVVASFIRRWCSGWKCCLFCQRKSWYY